MPAALSHAHKRTQGHPQTHTEASTNTRRDIYEHIQGNPQTHKGKSTNTYRDIHKHIQGHPQTQTDVTSHSADTITYTRIDPHSDS